MLTNFLEIWLVLAIKLFISWCLSLLLKRTSDFVLHNPNSDRGMLLHIEVVGRLVNTMGPRLDSCQAGTSRVSAFNSKAPYDLLWYGNI